MKTNRRGFFKVLGAGAAATAVVKPVKAEKKAEVAADSGYIWREIMVSAYVPEHGTLVSAASTLTRWEDGI